MLDQAIESLLKSKADEVVFIELKEGKDIKVKDVALKAGIPVPIMFKNVIDKVQGISEADIHLTSIMEAMTFILGIDQDFPYKEDYMAFMTAVDPKLVESISILGHRAMDEENYVHSAVYFKSAWLFEKESPDIYLNYARACELAAEKKQGTQAQIKILEDEAYEVYMMMVDRFAHMPEPFYHIGFHLVNRKSFKAAQGVWEKAVALGIHDDAKEDILRNLTHLWSRIQYEEGYTLVLDGFPDEALVKLLPLEEDNPEWWNLMFFIGLAYRQKEDYDNAIYYYKRTLNLNTGHVDTFNEIGLCYMSMNMLADARHFFEEALRLSPENAEILCNLGIVSLNEGDIQAARKLINRAFDINPEDEVTQAWLKYLDKVERQ